MNSSAHARHWHLNTGLKGRVGLMLPGVLGGGRPRGHALWASSSAIRFFTYQAVNERLASVLCANTNLNCWEGKGECVTVS